jgi:hypothetical protein
MSISPDLRRESPDSRVTFPLLPVELAPDDMVRAPPIFVDDPSALSRVMLPSIPDSVTVAAAEDVPYGTERLTEPAEPVEDVPVASRIDPVSTADLPVVREISPLPKVFVATVDT